MEENTSILIGKSLGEANQIVKDNQIVHDNNIIKEVISIWKKDEDGKPFLSRIRELWQLHVSLTGDDIINGIFY